MFTVPVFHKFRVIPFRELFSRFWKIRLGVVVCVFYALLGLALLCLQLLLQVCFATLKNATKRDAMHSRCKEERCNHQDSLHTLERIFLWTTKFVQCHFAHSDPPQLWDDPTNLGKTSWEENGKKLWASWEHEADLLPGWFEHARGLQEVQGFISTEHRWILTALPVHTQSSGSTWTTVTGKNLKRKKNCRFFYPRYCRNKLTLKEVHKTQ